MEYGDLIVVKPYWKKNFIVRYRIDPVPYSGDKGYGRKNFCSWYKTPKTTQERKWSLVDKEYVRGRRNMRNLPNTWDDYQRSDIRTRKSWKNNSKTKRQWQKNSECNSMAEDQPSKLIMGVRLPPFAPKEII